MARALRGLALEMLRHDLKLLAHLGARLLGALRQLALGFGPRARLRRHLRSLVSLVLLHRLGMQRIRNPSADRGSFARMAGPADEARQLVDQRTVQLAKLHWALQSHATRVEVVKRWLDAFEPSRTRERDPLPAHPAGASAAPHAHRQVVLAPEDGATIETRRRLRVIHSEQREVSIEVDDRVPAAAPEIEPRYRRAS